MGFLASAVLPASAYLVSLDICGICLTQNEYL
jgi:hypothetical protein